jgi:predicted phosphatase
MMSKLTFEEKQAKKAAKRATWLATPISYVEKPMKYIASQLNTVDKDGNKVEHFVYKEARVQAIRGNGSIVQQLALSLARKQHAF